MTESEWLTSTDTEAMLRYLESRVSIPRMRLLAAACTRRIWDRLDAPCRKAVEVGEAHAHGQATDEALKAAYDKAEKTYYQHLEQLRRDQPGDYGNGEVILPPAALTSAAEAACVCVMTHHSAIEQAPRLVAATVAGGWRNPRDPAVYASLAELIRDIAGDLYQRHPFDARWRTRDVASLALAAYENRVLPSGELERDRLCILADALEDAGCTSEAILEHLRSSGPHVWGCWAMGLVMGKE